MTNAGLQKLIETLAKRKRTTAEQYYHGYEACCEKYPDNPFAVWLQITRYSEFWDFSQDIEQETETLIQDGEPKDIAGYLISLKYPDLQNILTWKIVYSSKGVDVLKAVIQFKKTDSREYAIYSMLHSAVFKDKNNGTYDIPLYVSVVSPIYFVKVFFDEVYNYQGIFKEPIYETLLTDIVSMCHLIDNILVDNLGCILVLVERGLGYLDISKKESLLQYLDNWLINNAIFTKGYSEPEQRIIKARCRLISDIYDSNYEEGFDRELSESMTRFEGWRVSDDSKYNSMSKECVVLLSWQLLSSTFSGLADTSQIKMITKIYERLQSQIKYNDVVDNAYNLTLHLFMKSLNQSSALFSLLVERFICETDNLYFVMDVLDDIGPLKNVHRQLLEDRWNVDKDTVIIKTRQINIWPKHVENLVRRLGLKM